VWRTLFHRAGVYSRPTLDKYAIVR
jgi:hypothetical protein